MIVLMTVKTNYVSPSGKTESTTRSTSKIYTYNVNAPKVSETIKSISTPYSIVFHLLNILLRMTFHCRYKPLIKTKVTFPSVPAQLSVTSLHLRIQYHYRLIVRVLSVKL